MTFHSQTGPQTVNERSRQTRPAPIAQKSGAIHSARNQPAAVKRLQPRRRLARRVLGVDAVTVRLDVRHVLRPPSMTRRGNFTSESSWSFGSDLKVGGMTFGG